MASSRLKVSPGCSESWTLVYANHLNIALELSFLFKYKKKTVISRIRRGNFYCWEHSNLWCSRFAKLSAQKLMQVRHFLVWKHKFRLKILKTTHFENDDGLAFVYIMRILQRYVASYACREQVPSIVLEFHVWYHYQKLAFETTETIPFQLPISEKYLPSHSSFIYLNLNSLNPFSPFWYLNYNWLVRQFFSSTTLVWFSELVIYHSPIICAVTRMKNEAMSLYRRNAIKRNHFATKFST